MKISVYLFENKGEGIDQLEYYSIIRSLMYLMTTLTQLVNWVNLQVIQVWTFEGSKKDTQVFEVQFRPYDILYWLPNNTRRVY